MNNKQIISSNQELHIAYKIGGEVQPNSGGTKFGGGDVLTNNFLIEAKTPLTSKLSFSIRHEWLMKAQEQAYEQGRIHAVLAFQFQPYGNNYYVLNENDFIDYVNWKEGRYDD